MYARERKELKRELLKLRDTEYTNFLLKENENIKQLQRMGNNAINGSRVEEEDEAEDEDSN